MEKENTIDSDYVPYGLEWEIEMMKLKKIDIIRLFRESELKAKVPLKKGYDSCFNLQIKENGAIYFNATPDQVNIANGFYHARSLSMDNPMWGFVVQGIARAYDDHQKGENPYTNGGVEGEPHKLI